MCPAHKVALDSSAERSVCCEMVPGIFGAAALDPARLKDEYILSQEVQRGSLIAGGKSCMKGGDGTNRRCR